MDVGNNNDDIEYDDETESEGGNSSVFDSTELNRLLADRLPELCEEIIYDIVFVVSVVGVEEFHTGDIIVEDAVELEGPFSPSV